MKIMKIYWNYENKHNENHVNLSQSMHIIDIFKLNMKIIENHTKTQTIENQWTCMQVNARVSNLEHVMQIIEF